MGLCQLRRDFPMLRESLIYLDNAASTLKPVQVIEAMSGFARGSYANVHRGVYREAVEATRMYEEAHSTVERFICARPGEVIFTGHGTTGGLHLAALLALANGLVGRGDEIIASMDAHNSNLLTWRGLARLAGARLRLVPVDSEGVPRWDLLGEMITRRTRIVAVGHVSNVTGYESPVREIARIAHEAGALVIVDGAQSVPHFRVCPRSLGVDMLAFSPHKMLGPTGIGVLWVRGDLARSLEPPLGGGGTVEDVALEAGDPIPIWADPPLRFEAGTPPIIEAVGLAAAVEYLERAGMDRVESHERALVERALRLLSGVPGVRIVGPRDPSKRRGIVTFTLEGVHPDDLGLSLGARRIAVRTGKHCAGLLYRSLGLPHGAVRASFYLYNCPWEVDELARAVGEEAGSG